MENHPSEVNRKSEKIRKWNWIGHTLRKETGAIEKTALDWNLRDIEGEVGRRECGVGQQRMR